MLLLMIDRRVVATETSSKSVTGMLCIVWVLCPIIYVRSGSLCWCCRDGALNACDAGGCVGRYE